MIKLKSNNIKNLSKWAAFIGVLGLALYPIIIKPMIDPTPYKEIQRVARCGIDIEKIQPGNMKVWSDPFDRKIENQKQQ